MKRLHPMREALADPDLLGGALPGDSYLAWRTLLIAAFGEELTDEERRIFTEVTGREREPMQLVDELWAIVGRRGGKTRAAGTIAAYVSGLCDHDYLAPGERAVLPILAATTTQADRAFQHARGILEHSPVLSRLIEGEPTSEIVRLVTRVDIEVRPANYKTIRGITAPAAIGDEAAFWNLDGTVSPDTEVLNALRPALATTGGPLIVISSAYAKRGEVYSTFRRDHGPNGDPLILVAKAPSRTFNPTLPERVIQRAIARDQAAARSEYLSEFRSDIEQFVDREVVEACVLAGVRERGYAPGLTYRAFVDPSGGSVDAMTMAIGHREDDRACLDVVRVRQPPFSPEEVVDEFCTTLKAYGIYRVTGDRYAGEWPREQFRKRGVTYEIADRTRSDYYRDMLPLLNSGKADLLDNEMLVTQIVGLERRVARGGKESIDHAPNAHDDLANSAAGVLCLMATRSTYSLDSFGAEEGDAIDTLWRRSA